MLSCETGVFFFINLRKKIFPTHFPACFGGKPKIKIVLHEQIIQAGKKLSGLQTYLKQGALLTKDNWNQQRGFIFYFIFTTFDQ